MIKGGNQVSHGGARSGAGRKPKGVTANVRKFTPTVVDGKREPGGVSPLPPEDLPAEQRDFWHRNAQRAIDQGTLTQETEAAFRLLCETDSEKVKVRKTIEEDGRTFIKITVDGAGQEHSELKAHPLTRDYRSLMKQLQSLMKDFKLGPFGKPEARGRPQNKPAANPWAAVSKR